MTATASHESSFEKSFLSYCSLALCSFKRISRFYTLFHTLFFSLAIGEVIALLLFFSFFTRSSMIAFSLGGLFLTGFSYFVLLFYFQAKKPEQLIELRSDFLQHCKETLPFASNSAEYHGAITEGIYHLVRLFDLQEYHFYRLPSFLGTLNPVVQKFSSWSHWKDVHQMKEQLLFAAIAEHVEQVKLSPTDLEAHASLADAYYKLALLYRDPRKLHPEEPFPWISPEYVSDAMTKKFRRAAERAIEEYKIVDSYAPGTPWTHAQLAKIYRDLEMPYEEIRCYEILLDISPDDPRLLFRLGVLYFEQGMNAKALKIYEMLKESEYAEELISYYDASSREWG